jgi:hypothetical protein
VLFRRLYALVFIELATRHVYLAGVTANPSGDWATEQARNIVETFVDRAEPIRFLIHDRDSKFKAAFDEVFRSDGIRTIRTPVRAPRANAFIERWIGTARRECLDRLLIVNRRHLERVLPIYIRHYNEHRAHRSLDQRSPIEEPPPESEAFAPPTVSDAETYSEDSFTSTPRHDQQRTGFPAPSASATQSRQVTSRTHRRDPVCEIPPEIEAAAESAEELHLLFERLGLVVRPVSPRAQVVEARVDGLLHCRTSSVRA